MKNLLSDTIELLPALRFDCNLCSNQSWHNCILYTGIEAAYTIMEDLNRNEAARRFIQKIQQRIKELDVRIPVILNLESAVLIKANNICCKTCDSKVGYTNRGFAFTCEECGRNNYILPESDSVTHVECEHCNSKFEAEHFMHEVMSNARGIPIW